MLPGREENDSRILNKICFKTAGMITLSTYFLIIAIFLFFYLVILGYSGWSNTLIGKLLLI